MPDQPLPPTSQPKTTPAPASAPNTQRAGIASIPPTRPAHMAPPALGGLALRLRTLTVFRALLSDPVVQKLLTYLDVRQANAPLNACLSAYGDFVAALYGAGFSDLASYIREAVNNDENPFVHAIGRREEPAACIVDATHADLHTLQAVADLTPDALCDGLAWQGALPEFSPAWIDLTADYLAHVNDIGRYGYGMYARYRMFYLGADGRIVAVRNPDRTRLSELVDYKRQQQAILDNTRALLAGRPAANILLTGDAGTGKSSTVKAVVNELADEGLRILEVRKDQLHAIPGILDELTCNPLKFILFIDDLSFQRDDDNYAALKAILEGSVAAKSPNVVIYATSNRRHLIKESFSDRDGDDVHRNDTMQEIVSLSERFGLQVSFFKPNKATYLDIVRHLAAEAGLIARADTNAQDADGQGAGDQGETSAEEAEKISRLEADAEKFALGRGGRSARAARQFVDSLLARG